MAEHNSWMGISPNVVNFQNKGLNREALPGDTVFTTPEAMTRTYPLHMISTYAITPPHLKQPLLGTIAKDLATDPTQLHYFWSEASAARYSNEDIKLAGKEVKNKVVPLLGEAASKLDTFSIKEEGLVTIFSALNPHEGSELNDISLIKPATELFKGLIDGTLHSSMRGLRSEKLSSRLKGGAIKMEELQYSQDRLVHLLYTLTNGVLKTHDQYLYQKLHDLLSFRTPFLNYRLPQAGLQAAAGFSLDNDTLAKAVLVDFTNSLFEAIYHPGSDEAGKNLQETIERSPVGMHYLRTAKKRDHNREDALMDFYNNRYGKIGQMQDTEMDVEEYYTRVLPFPENEIYSQNKELWVEYLKLFSTYALDNKLMEYPMEIIFLPDNTVRHVAMVDDDPFHAAQATYRHISKNNAEISNAHVIESFLTYLRPRLLGTTTAGLKINNNQRRDNLIQSPSRGLSSMGLTVIIDQKNNPAIDAQSLSFDQSGSILDIQIENTTLHMRLNDQYELCSLEGFPLQLGDDVRVWWDHVILPQLHQYICVASDENEGYMDGIDLLPEETPQAATKRVITKKIGHLRRLGLTPDGREKHHTPEQRLAVMERKFLLPHIETLDLDIFNQDRPYGEKVTFVLPIERELTERPIFHLPNAYKEDASVLAGDPQFGGE